MRCCSATINCCCASSSCPRRWWWSSICCPTSSTAWWIRASPPARGHPHESLPAPLCAQLRRAVRGVDLAGRAVPGRHCVTALRGLALDHGGRAADRPLYRRHAAPGHRHAGAPPHTPHPLPAATLPLGTDMLGRDITAGMLYGARVSLLVGLVSTLVALVFGILIGAVAGYGGGRIDDALMRLTEFFQTIPQLAMAVVIVAIF